jgi:uncharacterized membrane-anchored protein
MRAFRALIVPFALVAGVPLAAQGPAADTTAVAEEPSPDSLAKLIAAFEAKLTYQTGTVQLPHGLATLALPPSLRFLDEKDARTLLTKGWGNPPETAEGVLGMVVPAGLSPLADEGWGIIIEFEDEGFVNDSDAATLDYPKMMREMQASTREGNKDRQEAGYGAVELVGWAEPPHYEAATHKLYWAKELAFDGNERHTLNYNIRILGRRGVLVLNAVGSMDQLDLIHQATPEVLAAVEFNEGHRYSDFTEGDKVAAYGIGGLILGGIATKAGFFKMLWLGILAGKKFIVIGVAAAGAWLKKKFGGQKEEGAAT